MTETEQQAYKCALEYMETAVEALNNANVAVEDIDDSELFALSHRMIEFIYDDAMGMRDSLQQLIAQDVEDESDHLGEDDNPFQLSFDEGEATDA